MSKGNILKPQQETNPVVRIYSRDLPDQTAIFARNPRLGHTCGRTAAGWPPIRRECCDTNHCLFS